MSEALGIPEKNNYCLVEFVYGDVANSPVFARYTDWDQDQGSFVSTPDMEVKLPPNTGVFGDNPCTLEMPLDTFTDLLSAGPRYEIYVSIVEVTRSLNGAANAANLNAFRGRLVSSRRNPAGRKDSVLMTFKAAKAFLAKPLGLPANSQCVWQLFGRGCSVDGLVKTGRVQGAQIIVITGKQITIQTPNTLLTAPTSPGGNVDRYWERGYMEKDGLRIGIHKWELINPTIFFLRSRPPNSWLMAGALSIQVTPGCHKEISDCRAVWNNEIDFMGFGYAILAYNPIFEQGATA